MAFISNCTIGELLKSVRWWSHYSNAHTQGKIEVDLSSFMVKLDICSSWILYPCATVKELKITKNNWIIAGLR